MKRKQKEKKSPSKKTRYKAIILYDNKKSKTKHISPKDETFSNGDKTYNILLEDALTIETRNILGVKTKHILYSNNNPDPLEYQRESLKPKVMSAKDYHTQLHTFVLQQANKYAMKSDNPLKNIKTEHLMLAAMALAALIYFATGGTLT